MLLLSMSIGVASVVILTGLGEGARQYVLGEFAALGKDVLVVLPGRRETTGGIPPVTGSAVRDLTIADADAIARLPGVRRVAPIVLGTAEVSRGAYSRESIVMGSTDELLAIRRLDIAVGSGLPPSARSRDAIAVIGTTLNRELFGGGRALGEHIRIGSYRYRIRGTLAEGGGAFGMNISETVMIPVLNAMTLFNVESLFRVVVEVNDNANIDKVSERILTLMTARHEGEPDVTLISPDALMATFDEILVTLTLVVASIGGVSLVVAGILIILAAIAVPKNPMVTGRVIVARLRVQRRLEPCKLADMVTRHRIR